MTETTGTHEVYDVTGNTSGGYEELSFTRPTVEYVEAFPERVRVRAGTFACDLDHRGMGVVTIDGQPVKCRKIVMEWNVKELVKVSLDILPLPSNHKRQER